jgi:U3 small nucleolar RNA-associated protein 23
MQSVVDPKGSGTNKNRYVLATQDSDVRKWMRSNVAGVPMIYVARSVMILEPMSGKTEDVREKEERSKIRAGLIDRRRGTEAGEKRKREEDTDAKAAAGETAEGDTAAVPKRRKLKGPKGPNPLSVRKTKKASDATAKGRPDGGDGAKTKRPRSDSGPHKDNIPADASLRAQNTGTADVNQKRKRKRKPKGSNAGATEVDAQDGDSN